MLFPQALQMILVITNILEVLIQSIPTSGHQYTGTPAAVFRASLTPKAPSQ